MMADQLPRFAVGSCDRFPGINYRHPKPFRNWTDMQMSAAIGGWLGCNPPAFELATLAHNELRRRGTELKAAMKFADFGLEPIGWLNDAVIAVHATFTPDVLQKQKRNPVAITQLDELGGLEGTWGEQHPVVGQNADLVTPDPRSPS